jgi:hypothetical protein
MRLPFLLFFFAAIFATAARGDDDCRCWTPGGADIAAAEAKIAAAEAKAGRRLPLGSLDRYARYYAGVTDNNGRRYIQGKLVPVGGNDTPGIHVVEGRMSPLQGEGCITLQLLDPSSIRMIRCARPGSWTPSDGQIAELEGLLPHFRDYVYAQDYARYYWGVTEDDHRIVIGALIVPAPGTGWTPGIHIVSDVYFPMMNDGGCGFVTVRYDPSSKEISSRCNGMG